MAKYNIEEIINRMPDFSWLTPISIIDAPVKKGSHRKILCKCRCGIEKSIFIHALISGDTISCGCYFKKIAGKTSIKYKNNVPDIYKLYHGIKSRCYNPKFLNYNIYGGRGVVMCEEWLNDYQKFLDWCLANGWKKGLQLDKDIKGNGLIYSPDTCIFVTEIDNLKARSYVHKIIYDGVEQIASNVGKKLGISKTTVNRRIKEGWEPYKAATTPINYSEKPVIIRNRDFNGKYI